MTCRHHIPRRRTSRTYRCPNSGKSRGQQFEQQNQDCTTSRRKGIIESNMGKGQLLARRKVYFS